LSDLDITSKNSAIRKGLRDIDPTNPGSTVGEALRGGPDHYNIYVKNGTSVPIQVHVVWHVELVEKAGEAGAGSLCINPSTGCSSPSWKTDSYWTVQPGQKAFLIDDAKGSSIAYFSAKSLDGTIKWDEKNVDMGSKYGNFIYTFSRGK
jgi:hypothetical protein